MFDPAEDKKSRKKEPSQRDESLQYHSGPGESVRRAVQFYGKRASHKKTPAREGQRLAGAGPQAAVRRGCEKQWQIQQCKRAEDDRAQQQGRRSRRFLGDDRGAGRKEERAEDACKGSVCGNPRRQPRKDPRYKVQIKEMLRAERHHGNGEKETSKRRKFVHDPLL